MNRVPFCRTLPDSYRSNIFIDSCSFDPKHEPETSAANQLKVLYEEGKINLLIAHSTAKELDHPNVPREVMREAQGRIRSLEVQLTGNELDLKRKILEAIMGNGKPENMFQDTEHIFEAQKYGSYFITVDKGILRKADDLRRLCGLIVLLPSTFTSELERYA